jgi:hypothetical protein
MDSSFEMLESVGERFDALGVVDEHATVVVGVGSANAVAEGLPQIGSVIWASHCDGSLHEWAEVRSITGFVDSYD